MMPSKLYPSALDGFCLSCFSTSFRASSVCPARSSDSASAKGGWATAECGVWRPDSFCWAAFPLEESKINPNARTARNQDRRFALLTDACGDEVSKGIRSALLQLNVAFPVPAEPSYAAGVGATG